MNRHLRLLLNQHRNRLQQSILGKSLPTKVNYIITNRCNILCEYCKTWKNCGPELSPDDARSMLFNLRTWIGSYQLTITGGEPLLRHDLFSLLKFCRTNGIITNVITNGSLLEEKYNSILSCSPDILTVSVDSFHRTRKNLDKSGKLIPLSKKINIKISTVVFSENIDDIIPLVKWSNSKPILGIELQALQGNPNLLPEAGKARVVFDNIIKLSVAGYPLLNSKINLEQMQKYYSESKINHRQSCTLGTESITINPNAGLVLCDKTYETGIRDIKNKWEQTYSERQKARLCDNPCKLQACNFKERTVDSLKRSISYAIRMHR